MKFTREQTAQHWIKGYSPGEVRVGEQALHASCLISPDQLIDNWRPQTLAELTSADFDAVFDWQPEIILLGTGEQQRFPERSIYANILSRGIGFEVMNTGAACRTFNVLVTESRRVVAAIIVERVS